jgi:hypothetical protein
MKFTLNPSFTMSLSKYKDYGLQGTLWQIGESLLRKGCRKQNFCQSHQKLFINQTDNLSLSLLQTVLNPWLTPNPCHSLNHTTGSSRHLQRLILCSIRVTQHHASHTTSPDHGLKERQLLLHE